MPDTVLGGLAKACCCFLMTSECLLFLPKGYSTCAPRGFWMLAVTSCRHLDANCYFLEACGRFLSFLRGFEMLATCLW